MPVIVPRTNPPVGTKVLLGWDIPADPSIAGFRVYASSNKTDWRVVATVPRTNRATVTNIFLPQWFIARSSTSNGVESVPSNRLGILATDRIIEVRGRDEASVDLRTWSGTNRLVACLTNPPGQQFFRTQPLAISTRLQLRTETTP
jgi:hypothetical protein